MLDNLEKNVKRDLDKKVNYFTFNIYSLLFLSITRNNLF
jgi:hypothetical protein